MDTRHLIAYLLIALMALSAAVLLRLWHVRARRHRRAMRGHGSH